MSLQNIPNELRHLKQWVAAGPDKVPLNPRTGAKADPTDPTTWGTFDEACRAGMKHIGFVLSKDDPYSAIDLDKPVTPEQAERHQHILEAAESYAELSQSGEGVHIFVKGAIPHGVRRDKVEVYSDARYMICTGRALNSLPIVEAQPLLDVLFKEMATTGRAHLEEVEEELSDEQLYDVGAGAANGAKFEQLWKGEWEQDWPSQSEADFALMSMLCYYSRSNEQCRRVFRMSELGTRGKAQRNKYLDYMISKCRAKEPPPVDLEAIRNQPPTHETNNSGQLNGQEVDCTVATTASDESAGEISAGTNTGLNRSDGPHVASADDLGEAERLPSRAGTVVYPPGLIGNLAEYFHESAIRPVREIALASALALAAGISGRSYNVSGTGLNQYLILLAKTGSGKEGLASGIDAVVAALRPTIPMVDRFIGPSAFASGQALIRCLDERPCFVSILGEIGITLQQLSDPRAQASTTMLKKVILDLYNKSGFGKVVRPSVYSDSEKNTKMVHAPNVSIIGESTPEQFYGGLDASQVTNGLLPRFSLLEYTGLRPERNRSAFQPPPDDLLNELGALVTLALTTQQNNTCQPVQIESTAEAVLDELDDFATRMINNSNEIERELWNRAHLKALKLSALVAVGLNPSNPVVDTACAAWARDFAFNDVSLLVKRFTDGEIGEGQGKQEADIRRAMNDYKSIPAETRRTTYRVPEKLMREKMVVPFHYLRRRMKNCASFVNDRRGFTAALESTLAQLVKDESLQLIDRKTASETFGVSQPLYARGIVF